MHTINVETPDENEFTEICSYSMFLFDSLSSFAIMYKVTKACYNKNATTLMYCKGH